LRIAGTRMTLAYRDERPDGLRLRRSFRPVGHGMSAAFEQTIRTRYGATRTPRLMAGAIVRQGRSAPTTHHHYGIQFHLAPHLNLTLVGRTQASTTSPMSDRRGPLVVQAERADALAPWVVRTIRQRIDVPADQSRFQRAPVTSSRDEIVQRVLARVGRIEVSPTGDASPPSRPGVRQAVADDALPEVMAATAFAQPLTRVVHRIPPGAVSTPSATASDRETTRSTADIIEPAVARQGAPAPARIDVNRLTDDVIRAIDRRIIAQRERFGRG
jgi:hypothetical protein